MELEVDTWALTALKSSASFSPQLWEHPHRWVLETWSLQAFSDGLCLQIIHWPKKEKYIEHINLPGCIHQDFNMTSAKAHKAHFLLLLVQDLPDAALQTALSSSEHTGEAGSAPQGRKSEEVAFSLSF